jgi:DNA-binding protein
MSPTYGTIDYYLGRYVSRALTLFLGEGKSFIVLKAAGRLMYRALWVAEVLKRKIVGLHQITEIK